jgi:hypothetical protein
MPDDVAQFLKPCPDFNFNSHPSNSQQENNVSLQRLLGANNRSIIHLRSLNRNPRQHPLLLRPPLRKTKYPLPLLPQLPRLAPPRTPTYSSPPPLSPVYRYLYLLADSTVCEICTSWEFSCGIRSNGIWRCGYGSGLDTGASNAGGKFGHWSDLGDGEVGV